MLKWKSGLELAKLKTVHLLTPMLITLYKRDAYNYLFSEHFGPVNSTPQQLASGESREGSQWYASTVMSLMGLLRRVIGCWLSLWEKQLGVNHVIGLRINK